VRQKGRSAEDGALQFAPPRHHRDAQCQSAQEQIDYQLGHIPRKASRTTHDYGQYEPGYLSEASAALDAWIARVLKLAAARKRIQHENQEMPRHGSASREWNREVEEAIAASGRGPHGQSVAAHSFKQRWLCCLSSRRVIPQNSHN
jgi:hypothetical protein